MGAMDLNLNAAAVVLALALAAADDDGLTAPGCAAERHTCIGVRRVKEETCKRRLLEYPKH